MGFCGTAAHAACNWWTACLSLRAEPLRHVLPLRDCTAGVVWWEAWLIKKLIKKFRTVRFANKLLAYQITRRLPFS